MFDTDNLTLKAYFEETFYALTTGDRLREAADFGARQTDMLGLCYRYDAHFEPSFVKA